MKQKQHKSVILKGFTTNDCVIGKYYGFYT